jgi:hypothetical protein
MRRFRIYAVSLFGGIAGALAILAISAWSERQQAQEWMERMRHAPLPIADGASGYVLGGPAFGPGLFTVFLAVMVSAAIYYLLFRWQDR